MKAVSFLHHVNLRVSDPESSLAFYRAFGLDVVGCMRMPGMYTLYLGSPGSPALLEFSVKEDDDPEWSTATGTGHLALSVDDLDAEITRLAESGIAPEGPPYHPGGRREAWVAFFRDPDGNRVELVHGAFPPPQDAVPNGLG